jgi:hypothetical protein
LTLGCSSNEEANTSNFVNKNSAKQIRIESLPIDKITISIPEGCSGTDFFRTDGKAIYFLDEIAYKVYLLNSENNSLTLVLNQGSGPKEIPRFQDYLFHNNQHYFFDGWTVYVFNTNWERERSFVIDFDAQKSMDELVNNPTPDISHPKFQNWLFIMIFVYGIRIIDKSPRPFRFSEWNV